jgi:hypothetical protein
VVALEPRLRPRLSAALALLAALVLVDEVIKEGYAFDPVDLVNPQVTHEKLFVVLLLASILLGLRKRKG